MYSKRVRSGRLVMVWRVIYFNRTVDLVSIVSTMDSQCYINVLQNAPLPIAKRRVGVNYIFQHDNAAVHTLHATKTYLEARDVYILDWPAKSPDFNIKENVWRLLIRKIHAEGRQFDNVSDLRNAITEAWNGMDLVYLRSLYRSISSRLGFVLKNHGSVTRYYDVI